MLIDGISLAEGSEVKNFVGESGAAFPTTPNDGHRFRLTADIPGYDAGEYWYSAAKTDWMTGDISKVSAGTGLTGGGSSGNVALALDLDYLNDRYVPQGEQLELPADPTSNMHAATKQYVDAVAQGLDVKASVRVATTGNIVLSGLQTVDTVSLNEGNRALVKDQIDAAENGLYAASAGAWIRTEDADTSTKINTGMYTFVEEGIANGGTGWNLITPGPINLNVTDLSFTQFASAGSSYLIGSGLKLTGSELSLNATTSDIPEGTNLYHTVARVRSSMSAGSGLTYSSATGQYTLSADTGDIAENGNLYHTAARARASVSAGTGISYSSATGVISASVTTVFGRTGAVVLQAADVSSALGYTALSKSGDTMSGTLDMNNNSVTGVKVMGFESELALGNSGSAKTIDFTTAQNQTLTLTANCTITVSTTNLPVGRYQLRLLQNGSNSYGATWGSSIESNRWLGSSTVPTVNIANLGETLVTFFWNGTKFTQSMAKVGAA